MGINKSFDQVSEYEFSLTECSLAIHHDCVVPFCNFLWQLFKVLDSFLVLNSSKLENFICKLRRYCFEIVNCLLNERFYWHIKFGLVFHCEHRFNLWRVNILNVAVEPRYQMTIPLFMVFERLEQGNHQNEELLWQPLHISLSFYVVQD